MSAVAAAPCAVATFRYKLGLVTAVVTTVANWATTVAPVFAVEVALARIVVPVELGPVNTPIEAVVKLVDALVKMMFDTEYEEVSIIGRTVSPVALRFTP